MASSKLIEIGLLTRAHGLRGEVCVDYYADSPSLLLGPQLYMKTGKQPPRLIKVEAVRAHKGRPLLLIEGIKDRTAAEGLRGRTLLIPEDHLPRESEEDVYFFELEGLSVILDDTDEVLGILESIDTPADQEVWVIRTPDGKEVLFPAADPFIGDVDLDAGTVRIMPPEGLLDIYLSE
ncbi:MAG: ribosome maturation factor RimM [Pseudomonadota bacterium]